MDQPLILNRYRPLNELGQGGYGSVELAWDTRIQRRVAIKRLALPSDAAYQRGATGEKLTDKQVPGLAEARTAAMLSHPNIVSVYDFDTDSDEAFLIMEYIEGLTLREVLDEEGPLSLDEAAALVNALCDALYYAHDNGVLHLDIKPENILIDTNGRIKIADFGISSISTAMGHGATLTGTLGYMPPEQLTGEDLDARSDEWAFASVIYEALSGENPFMASTPDKSLTKIYAPYLTPITTYRTDLPPEADTTLITALEPEPFNRFAHLEDLAIDLLEILGDPQEGRSSFAAIVQDELDDEQGETFDTADLGLWDRIPYRAIDIGRRVLAGASAGIMTYLGLGSLFLSESLPILWTVSAVIALVAIFVPELGALLALIPLCIGLFAAGSYYLGVTVVVVGLLWWWFAGRYTIAEAVTGLLGPFATFIFIPTLTPLLAGFTLPVKRALPSVVAAWVFSTATYDLMVLTFNNGTPIATPPIATTALYLALLRLAGWIAATVVTSVFCRRASRSLAIIGTLLGSACILAAYLFGERLVTGAFPNVVAEPSTILSIVLSTILMIVICGLGSPLRAEEEF